MAFLIRNETNVPINVRVSNAGLTKYFKNDIPPHTTHLFQYGYDETGVQDGLGAVGYDIHAYYKSASTEISFNDNISVGLGIAGSVLGILGTIAGIVLLVVPGAQPAAAALTSASLAAIQGGAIAGTIIGGISTTLGIAGTALSAQISPVGLDNMYGPDNYTITVTGGMTFIENPTKPGEFELQGPPSPIGMDWHNETRGTSGSASGTIINTHRSRDGHPHEDIKITLPYIENSTT